MQAVILAGGSSTRTYPLTLTRPKALLPVMNRPILEHTLDALDGLASEVIVVVGYLREQIERYGPKYRGMRLRYVLQQSQLGTAHALMMAEPYLKDRFLVVPGDDIFSPKEIRSVAKHRYAVLAQKVAQPGNFGVLVTKDGRLVRIVEKPKQYVSDLANTGVYSLDRKVFGFRPAKSQRGEFEAVDFLTSLAKTEMVAVVEVSDFWLPIAYPWSLLEANQALLKRIKKSYVQGKVEGNVSIEGNVVIGEGTLIRSGTCIEGPVMIGKDCIIGPQAYIRPDTVIGDGCRIRAEVFDSIIMKNSTAKHYSYIGHSVLGEGCNIGAGTITADYRHDGREHVTVVKGEKVQTGRRKLGTMLGDGVKTGINTSIYPGRKIWPGLGTLPGQVVTRDMEA